MSSTADALRIRRYLLGERVEDDAQKLEEEYFVDDMLFSEVLAAEDELIERYLEREMNAHERQAFERRFLPNARGRQKIALAAALHARETRRARRWPAAAALAAALAIVIAGGAMIRQILVMRPQPETRVPVPRGPVFSTILKSAERSSGSSSTLLLPRHFEAVELWLVLPAHPYTAYAAEFQTIEGRLLFRQRELHARSVDGSTIIVFRIPSNALREGTFIVSVTGKNDNAPGEPVEDYSFTVQHP